ncbi:transcription elongation factor TFIIS-like [Prosopis cineraria]|uniref:transcription elongation factor TFIIS-like n=1 Tax=Prosopis cineraria TaxID=364024 RepID=UPI00240F4E2E|nr:transcription elongation factor TFIIS-like [Prosopis cineraria]
MEKELIRLYEAVKKAADVAAASSTNNSEVEENRCLDALKQLKKFPVDYQTLVSTQVGKHVRALTKHPRKNIRTFAMGVVEIWKAIVIKEINKNKKEKVEDEVQNRTDHSLLKIKVQDSRVRAEKTVSASTVKQDPEAAKKKTTIKSNDATRDRLREILQEAFSRVSGEVDDEDDEATVDRVKECDPIRVSAEVESALFQNWGCFKGPQKIRYRSLMFNLKDPKNPDFRRRVLLGEIEPERLVYMRTEDMASDERKKEIEKIKRKALFECERGQKLKATTDQFFCKKCGKRECTYYQMQTRSADEPMTAYVTCVACNNRWKFC